MRVKTLILSELFLERRDALETSFDPDPFQVYNTSKRSIYFIKEFLQNQKSVYIRKSRF